MNVNIEVLKYWSIEVLNSNQFHSSCAPAPSDSSDSAIER